MLGAIILEIVIKYFIQEGIYGEKERVNIIASKSVKGGADFTDGEGCGGDGNVTNSTRD